MCTVLNAKYFAKTLCLIKIWNKNQKPDQVRLSKITEALIYRARLARYMDSTEPRGPCKKCHKGDAYYDSGRQSEFCNNSECSYILSIEDTHKGKSETDLQSLRPNIIQELITDGKIPKDWNDK